MKKLTWLHLLLFFTGLKLLFHLCLNGQWSFHRDELLYLALGRHLDWGYASVPAGIGFWAWLGDSVLGGSVEAIRLISTGFGTATVLLTGLMAKEMLKRYIACLGLPMGICWYQALMTILLVFGI